MAKSDWDEGKPEAGIKAKLLDDRVRVNNSAIEAILNEDHVMVTGGDVDGFHRQVTFAAPISTPTSATNKGYTYMKDVGGKAELHYLDEDNNEIQLTSLGRPLSYVDRGDPAAADFTISGLILDDAWHDLALNSSANGSFLPTGIIAVAVHFTLSANAAGKTLSLRKKGHTTGFNISAMTSQVANQPWADDISIGVDSAATFQYNGPSNFTVATLVVKGYW